MVDVVCFGEILWDLFERPESHRRSRVRREPIARTFERQLGGAPANVATGLARLGVRTALVGGVGRDRFGDALVAHLSADGVDVRYVVRLPNRTGLAFVVRDPRGEPDFIFYRHGSADLAIRAEHLTGAMGRARWVLVGTSTSVTPDLARATERFLQVAETANARVFLDLNVREHLWRDRASMKKAIARLARRATVVKASDDDLRAVAGAAGGARWLGSHAPQATWLITRGSRAATAIGDHGRVELPALRTLCVDATGAGDAFIAGALATLVSTGAVPGRPAWSDAALWRAALRVGHIMGKKAVTCTGAVSGLVALGRARRAIAAVRGHLA
jgi:fructokinase